MLRFPTSTIAILLLAGTAFGQTTTATGDETKAEEEKEKPEFNGTLSGQFSNRTVSAPVICTGFDGGGRVTVQTDPGDDPTEDTTGDGVVADIEAFPEGEINLNLMAGNSRSKINDSTAVIEGKTLTFGLTMTFVGGGEEVVDIKVSCK